MSTDSGSHDEGEHHHPRLHAVSETLHEHEESYLRACQARWARVQGSAAGAYWSQLTATDFMTSSFAFAALGILCAFPFLAVVSAATGGDFREAIVARMGLNDAAAQDVNALISSGTHAVATLSATSAAFLLVGALGMASTLQAWYPKIYDQPPTESFLRRLAYQLTGLVAFSAYISANVSILNAVKPIGGHGLMLGIQFVLSTLYWWVSAYFILFRKIPLRKLFPAGLATGLFIAGLGVFSSFLFSSQITSGQKTYGPAGVVLAIISYLVGFGVCLHLGAVFGRVWLDWHAAGAKERIHEVEAPALQPELG
jgi:membrane protein